MKIIFLFFLATGLMVALLGNGCVTRTTTRSPNLSDYQSPSTRRKINDQGLIVETKTIWFWQR